MDRKIVLASILLSFLLSQSSIGLENPIKSLALPGWGESKIGEHQRAKTFFITEAGIWLIYFAGKKTSDLYTNDYQAFAALHANVNISDKDYLYAVNIGHYDTIDDYNDTKERQRLVNDKYSDSGIFDWSWDSTENRILYDELRIKSVVYNKYAKFALGGLILNRIISFFDVLYLEREKINLSLNTSKSYQNYNNIKITFSFDL